MALAIRNAARLKPEIQLSRALQDFEVILDHDQKAQFNEFRKESPPGASAPLAFTTLLDRGLQSRRSRRCIGPRVINLLQSTQQFSTVIDVLVGGSQNFLASSVWGILKLSLQIGSNYSQYFDKLSNLLMDIGRTCPQYQEFGTLFAESKALQRALCEYFAAVIDLCKHIVLFSRKRFIAQLPKLVLPFDAAFSDIQANLRRLSSAIRDEVTLAASKHQKEESRLSTEERKENARFRALAVRFRDQSLAEARGTNRHCLRHLRSDLLGRLSDYNHVTTWKQSRSKGAVKWILEEDAYKQWKTVSFSGILRLVGNLGSGKTVLMANVVADLVLQSHVTVGYFFCRFDDAASLKARTVIGSLARQLLLDVAFQVPESISTVTDVDDVVEFLLNVLLCESGRNNTICLDGLDECEEKERYQILSALKRLSSEPKLNLKIFYSTRADTQPAAGQILIPYQTIIMSSVSKNIEISEYIQGSLEQRLESKQLVLGDPSLILRIREELEEKANGMYLWVYFQLESLCEQTTDYDIIQTLDDLPRDMYGTYTRILSRIKNQPSLARKIFESIAVAERPFTTEELREALAVEPGELTLRAGSLVNDILRTLAQCCGSLLVVDEEDSTVQFVHKSVRQFFTGGIKEEPNIAHYYVDTKQATIALGICCVTYLNLGAFNTQLSKARNPAPWKGISPSKIIKSSLPEDSMGMKLALTLLRGGKDNNYDISKHLERVAALANPSTELTYAFLPYAKAYVFTHTRELLDCDTELDSMFYKTFNGYLPFVPKPWADIDGETLGGNATSWAVNHDHLGLIYRILRLNTSGQDHGSFGRTEKFRNVRERVLSDLLRLGFASQRIVVLQFVLQKVHMEPDGMMAILSPIIACGSVLLEEWKRHINLTDINIPLDSPQLELLERYEIKLKPRMIRYRNRALQTIEVDRVWDPFALAAASNNMAAIDLIKTSGEGMCGDLDATGKARVLQLLLRGLREAACSSNVAMFKYLLSSFPLRLYRQKESEVLDAEYDGYGWTPLHYAATLSDPEVYLTLRDEYYDKTAFVGVGLLPEQILSLAKGQETPVFEIDATEKEVVTVSQRNQDEATWRDFETEIRQTAADRPLWRLFARRGAKKANVVKDVPTFRTLQQLQRAELPANSISGESLRTSATPQNPFADSVHVCFPSPPHRQYMSPISADPQRHGNRQHVESYFSLSTDQNSPEVSATLFPTKGLHLSPLDTTSPALQSERSFLEATSVTAVPMNTPIESEVKAVNGIEDVATHPLRRVPFHDKDGPNIVTLSKRHSVPLQFGMHASGLDDEYGLQAQVLRAQNSAFEAQAALIRASRSTANGKPWWENPVLVFSMFVLWPSVLVCCLVYLTQRPEQSCRRNGQCIYDDLVHP